mmetsp:Transcript_5041/g.12587  ORF Transcript_5041/g.12587 Transcript_5041/m.12587 type:complete len:272 (+) Transcript_5041:190-1005(+)
MEARVDILAHLGDLEHLAQLVQVARDQVEEGEPLKVLRALVGELEHLVVALPQRLGAQPAPALCLVQHLGAGQRRLDVAAVEREVEAGALVTHQMEGHLRKALALQVGDDALADQIGVLHHAQHHVELAPVQRQLEAVLGAENRNGAIARLAIQAVHTAVAHAGDVDGRIQRENGAVVAVGQQELDVVERRVDEHPVLVPGAALHAATLVYHAQLVQVAVGQHDGVAADQRHQRVLSGATPHGQLDPGRGHLGQHLVLLQVEERHLVVAAQ